MAGAGRSPWLPWAAAAAAGVAGLALVLALFRPPPGPAPARPPPSPPAAVLATGANSSLVREEAALFDPTPLFLPTPWNSTQKEAPAPAPGAMFDGYPPKQVFGAGEPRLRLAPPIAVPGTPAGGLAAEPPSRPFLGFGRSDAPIPPPPARRAFVEAFDAGTGRRVLGLARMDADPPVPADGWWRPPEFLAAVDPAGLVGSLVLTGRSGSAEVDAYFLRYLEETVRVGQRLPPGFYRICVGP